jgi:hypothetical protein
MTNVLDRRLVKSEAASASAKRNPLVIRHSSFVIHVIRDAAACCR